jgi:hypothetical protein
MVKERDDRNKADADAKKAEEDEKLITEKGGMSGGVAKGKDLSPQEAGEIAYRKAFGGKD